MKRGTRIIFTALRVVLAIGLLLYLGFSGAIQWSALLGMATAWPVTLAAFGLLFLAVIVTAWRLCVILRPRGFHLSLAASLRLTLIGTFFNTCLPGAAGGDLVKIYYATKGNRGRRTEVMTIMLLDRAAGMFAMLVWPLLATPFFSDTLGALPVLRGLLWAAAAVAGAMLVGMGIVAASGGRSSRLTSWIIQKFPMGHYADNIIKTVHAYRNHWRILLAAVGISLLAHTITIGVMLLAATTINPGGAAWEMSLLIPLGFIVNVVPLTPGGLGVGEAAFDTLFSMAGLSGGAETLLGWRLLVLLVGLIGLFFYVQGRKRFVHENLPHGREEAVLLPLEEPG